jgi:hypothetical protein
MRRHCAKKGCGSRTSNWKNMAEFRPLDSCYIEGIELVEGGTHLCAGCRKLQTEKQWADADRASTRNFTPPPLHRSQSSGPAKKPSSSSSQHPKSHQQLLQEGLAKVGLTEIVMESDGNCFFRSVAYALYGDASLNMLVRLKIVAFMRKTPSKYEAFVVPDAVTFAEYTANMEKPGILGGSLRSKPSLNCMAWAASNFGALILKMEQS